MGDETPANAQTPAPAGVVKKKKDEKYRKRDPRSWENVMRATANMTLEERLHYVENIYNEIYNESRTTYINLQARDKQYTQCLREHEKDRAELTKSILARGHLESLCRELQKQNKLIKEENVARIKEEEDRRREVANTFTERLNALTNLITESKDKSNKVKEENLNMAHKLTELYEQYQQREAHLETISRQLDLQKKLAETQAKKVEIEHEAERQTLLSQKKALELQTEQYEKEIVLLQEKNRSLEAQVDLYKSQYSDFESTMSKSNKVFDTFKEEMSRMSKHLHTLETERNDLRKKLQSSVNSIIVFSEEHMALSNEQKALEKRLQMLKKLCRQLQEDRSAFLKQLKENNIEPIVSSLKNGDKETEPEERVGISKNEPKSIKFQEDIDKMKKAVKMSDSEEEIPLIHHADPGPIWPVNGYGETIELEVPVYDNNPPENPEGHGEPLEILTLSDIEGMSQSEDQEKSVGSELSSSDPKSSSNRKQLPTAPRGRKLGPNYSDESSATSTSTLSLDAVSTHSLDNSPKKNSEANSQ